MRPDVMAIPLVSKQPDADSERFARADAVLGAKKKQIRCLDADWGF